MSSEILLELTHLNAKINDVDCIKNDKEVNWALTHVMGHEAKLLLCLRIRLFLQLVLDVEEKILKLTRTTLRNSSFNL